MAVPSRSSEPAAVHPWMALAFIAAVLLAYLPALGAGTIWDDDSYLTDNPVYGSLGGLRDIWVPGNTPQYYPAVFTMFWLEHALWGLEPMGYHVVNVLLHAGNGLLVWFLARRLRLPGAFFLGALFALHPVHVESVAWITERKNVLSGTFFLLAALAWLRFDGEEGEAPRWGWYAASLAAFLLALLAKTVTCALPAVLILVLLWLRRPLTTRRLGSLAPMFALGLLLALQTARLERDLVGAEGAEFDFGLGERLLIAGNALVFYPQKLLLPLSLTFTYPRWELRPEDPTAWWPVVTVVVAGALALVGFLRGVRGPALALAFFAGSLVPALGFIDVYPMRYSFVADHFQYLASLGVLALVSAAGVRWVPAAAQRPAAVAVLGVLGFLTFLQCRDYEDEETLWRATLARNPGAWIAHNNLAELAADRGEYAEALELIQPALELTGDDDPGRQVRLNVAILLGKLGRHDEALPYLEELQRSQGKMEVRLALALERLGRVGEAESWYRSGLTTEGRVEILLPWSIFLLRQGRPAEAVAPLEELVEARPEEVDPAMVLADAYAGSGRLADAIAISERALAWAREQEDEVRTTGIERKLARFRGEAFRGGE